MADPIASLFARWRERGDLDALGQVFDRTAAELLRVALHLSRDVADAEDLVQATFLAAIESAERFDTRRPLVPWLVAILTHRAHAERRRSARATADGAQPDRRAAPDGEPFRLAAHRELEEATFTALDRLPEPYRLPTMLRVRHGLEPADIAIALGRSPGTVRAQIHRGLVKLRRLLPSSVVGAVALTANPARGLAAVKHTVLAGAERLALPSSIATGASPIAVLSGTVLMKKTIAIAALAAAALGIAFGMRPDATEPTPAPHRSERAATAAASAASRSVVERSAPAPAAAAAAAAEQRALVEAIAPMRTLRARIVDGSSRAPLAGARIEVHAPRPMSLLEFQREFGAYGRPTPSGGLASLIEWLQVPDEFDADVTLRGTRHPFLVRPAAEQRPLHAVTSDSNGRFIASVAATGAVVGVHHPGYGSRWMPVSEVADDEVVLELWPLRTVRGTVVMSDGSAPSQPLELMLRATGWPSSGAWFVTTGEDGSFEAEVAAEGVMVGCRTPGFSVTDRGVHPVRRHQWIQAPMLSAGTEGFVFVTRFGSARIHVTDAETGAPIEVIELITRDEHDVPRHCGRFSAPGGWFDLSPFDPNELSNRSPRGFPQRLDVIVSARGHASAVLRDVATLSEAPPIIEVALERGAQPALDGTVRRSGHAVESAVCRLRLFRRVSWPRGEALLLDRAETDDNGAFRLSAPPGEYLLEVVVDGSVEVQRPVTLPCDEPVRFDLDERIDATITVLRADSRPAVGHDVSIDGPGGQQLTARTDADGRARLGPLLPGEHSVSAPLEATTGSWVPGVTERVTATAGTPVAVTLRLPGVDPIRVRLAFVGRPPEQGFRGFTACLVHFPNTGDAEVQIAEDGTVPIDIVPQGARLRVTGRGGRRWLIDVPDGARSGHELYVGWSGLGYEGTVTDLKGQPITRGRVIATPVDGGVTVSVVTGEGGDFRLEGLEPKPHRLAFQSDASHDAREAGDNPLMMATFAPAALPGSPPEALQVRLPRFVGSRFEELPQARIHGRLMQDDRPLQGAIVSATTVIAQTGGELQVMSLSGWQYSAVDGRYSLTVAAGAPVRLRVSTDSGAAQEVLLPTVAPDAELERNIVVR